jgi:two-component system, sensor histidine kinase PdtaS
LIVNVDEITGGAKYAVPVGLILNELISNSLKYAFPTNQSGEIGILLKRESQEKVLLRYYDTGIGLPEGFDLQTSKSLGMRLVFNLAKQLNASVEFINHPGVKFCFSFSLDLEKENPTIPVEESEQGKVLYV